MLRRQDPLASPEPLIRRVYSYAAYRLGDGPDAEDATSETLERALRYRSSYDADAGTPQAWILGIARRIVGEHEARGRVPADALDDETAESAPGDDPSDRALDRFALRDALQLLSQDERDLFALRYGADLTAREIARVLGSRTNTVEVALHRAHARLRDLLDTGRAESRPAQTLVSAPATRRGDDPATA